MNLHNLIKTHHEELSTIMSDHYVMYWTSDTTEHMRIIVGSIGFTDIEISDLKKMGLEIECIELIEGKIHITLSTEK